MKQNYTISKSYFKQLFATFFLTLTIVSSLFAQTYVNGNIGTGATSLNGTAAPAGTTWHELQNVTGNTTESNSLLGSAHSSSGANDFALADDFIVPAGQTWTLSKLIVYSLDQVVPSTSTTSPYNNIRVRIWNGVPGNVGSSIVFGDMTTNRFAATAFSGKKGIFNSQVPTPAAPTPNLPIFSIEANLSATLTAGTYWVEWQVVHTANCFSVTSQTVGIRGLPSYNARQRNAAAWLSIIDGGNPATAPDFTVDYPFSINYTATGSPCTAVSPGVTTSTPAAACAGINFNLSVATPGSGLGLSHQWQKSNDNITYTDIAGATSPTLGTTQTAATWYRLRVTCGANAPLFSTPVQTTMSSSCYCIPATVNCSFSDDIRNVTFAGINNTSACTAGGYTNYSTTVAPASVIAGVATPMSVTVGPGGTEYVGVWIDYNQNGTFEATEFQLLGSGNGVAINGTINIPTTALIGSTRMRVRVQWNTALTGANACTQTSGFGEVEDYSVTINPCTPAVITTQPANVTAACGSNAVFTSAASGTVPSFQWQFRTSATGIWTNLTNVAPYSGVTTNTLTVASNPTLNNYQYRVAMTGACSGIDFSTPATLTVSQLVPSFTPTSANICNGQTQSIVINSVASPTPGSVTVNSAALNLNVVDNVPAGVNTPLTVAVPAGALVTGIRVRLNVASTWLGDLNVNLKAPNGQILNLSHNLSVTNGNATGGGSFVNTVIGSAFTTVLHTTASPDNPHTGNYKADAGTVTVAGITPNVTGFVPTTALWSALYGTPSGVWTLAMADIFPGGDVTTFQNWSITIDYVAGAPGTGIFTGPAGTMFTNAAATTAYTGTAINTIYVKPTTQGVNNYVLNYADGACTSAPITIPVTVNNAIAGTATVNNATICAGGNTSFTLGGTQTGGPVLHQWQVKTSATAAWANVAGATTATLNITAAPASWNGYQYRDSLYTAPGQGGIGCGSLLSTVGTLTVNATPVVTISAAPITKLFPGLTSTLTAAVSPSATGVTYQWTRNGVNVPGATSNRYVANIDGLGAYTVLVTDANGCSSTSTTPTSIIISDSATNNILFIYPSPNTGKFQVRYYFDVNNTNLSQTAYVNIYDEKGARVYTRQFSPGLGYGQMNIDLGTHGRGVYRVDLVNGNGERLKTGSVMVF